MIWSLLDYGLMPPAPRRSGYHFVAVQFRSSSGSRAPSQPVAWLAGGSEDWPPVLPQRPATGAARATSARPAGRPAERRDSPGSAAAERWSRACPPPPPVARPAPAAASPAAATRLAAHAARLVAAAPAVTGCRDRDLRELQKTPPPPPNTARAHPDSPP